MRKLGDSRNGVLFAIPMFCIAGLTLSWLAGFGSGSVLADAASALQSKRVTGNAAIAEFEPALAVRTSACITCHAKIHPGMITDFGYGDPYFFGMGGEGSRFGAFNGSIYGDFYGSEPNKTGWLTAEVGKRVVVPKAGFNFDLSAAGAKLADAYRKPLQSKSLAEYLRALEAQKPNPATVVEKEKVFIGAPTAEKLETRFSIAAGSGIEFKYLRNDGASPEVKGIGLSSDKAYYTNTAEIVCDGDLFIRGTLFLNGGVIATKTGCRIYATGPIFVQNAISYKNLGRVPDRTNLQLVSAKAILLGLGDRSCDASAKDSPLARRLIAGYAISTFFTREANGKSMLPKEFGQGIYDQGKRIPSLDDAGCHGDILGFSRLLLNAPQVHNRYKGMFRGIVIAEVALFRLGKSTFEFDPVFRDVPVLPVLEESDYLAVE